MNRNVLLAYLKNLRDLEVAKWQIEQLYDDKKENYSKETERLQELIHDNEYEIDTYGEAKPFYRNIPYKRVELLVIGGSCVIIDIIFFFLIVYGGKLFHLALGPSKLFAVKICFLPICILAYVCYQIYTKTEDERFEKLICNIKEYERVKECLDRAKQAEEERSAYQITLKEIAQKWEEEHTFLKNQQHQIETLLMKAYRLAILPGLYRNLSAVYYLYSAMSDSPDTLEEIIMQEQTKSEIQRIRFRLDTIISMNQKWILQNRCKEADEDETIQILESCQQTEASEANAALYAQIASNYAEANAYFSLANYLNS